MLLLPACPLAVSAGKMRAETHCFSHTKRKANSMGQKVVESMTAIERTIYPRFTRTPSAKEVRALYTPFPADRAFVEKHARGPAQKFSLMIMLKVYQRLHYFPDLQTIPGPVIGHIRSEMKYPDDLVPDIASATLYRYYLAIREELEIKGQSKETRRTAAAAMRDSAQNSNKHSPLFSGSMDRLRSPPLIVSKNHRKVPPSRTWMNGSVASSGFNPWEAWSL